MKNNIIKPTGLKGNEKVNRMRKLMGVTSINENNSHSVVELNKLGPDGKVYGVVRENHDYYIKIADNKPNLVAEDFQYIGGLQNQREVVYESYAKAIKQLNLKLMSLNEAFGYATEVNTFKNDGLLNESFESYPEAPKPSQPDTTLGTVKSMGKNDGHDTEIINDSGETGNPDVDTPPVVEEEDTDVDESNDDNVELTEGEKAIDRMILENSTPIAKEDKEIVAERRLSIATALQKIDEGINSQKKKN